MKTRQIKKRLKIDLLSLRLIRGIRLFVGGNLRIRVILSLSLFMPFTSFSQERELQLQDQDLQQLQDKIEKIEALDESVNSEDEEIDLVEDDEIVESEIAIEDELGILDTPVSQAELSAQLRVNLEAQFQQIQSLIKTEDAYSAKLGEEYLNYGLLLQRAGRVDEAREMIVDALHITKVNEGVYSLEQRPMLRALFETNLLLGKSEELVENFEKIIWLENKSPSQIGTYSFDLAVKLGHHFFDRYKIQSTRSNVSLELLDASAKYFSYAIRQYGKTNINELLMPYGELSEVHFYRSELVQRLSKQRDFSFGRRDSAFERVGGNRPLNFSEDTFSKTELYAKLHFNKAQNEKNQQQMVAALLALGDANLLFKRKKTAASYYKIAWEESLRLTPDDPVRLSLAEPVMLPAFNYALEKEEPKRQGAVYAHLPVIVNIDAEGKVTRIEDSVVGASSDKVASRARRAVKFSKFRPVIQNGELIPSSQHQETIRVLVSK